MDCKARINAQDPTYPTYKAMDCKMHCNANDDGFYGRIMDCEAIITNLIVSACRSWNQGIRLVVTIDGINVSAALIDSLSIRHDKNTISDFSFFLGNTKYSPRTNSHIDLDKEVVITAYINGQEKKLITGTLDEPSAENTPDFRVSITGRDYGKKLLDKKATIVSVQDLADSTLRNDVIKYLAKQASITAVDIPKMDAVTIDNSFSYQSIWDMIQKEMMVELYWIKFDEDGNLKLLLDEVKSDTDLYPTPDWTYDEDRIIRLGYKKGRLEVNKITVLGKIDSTIITKWNKQNFELNGSITWAADEDIEEYTAKIGGFDVNIIKSANWASYNGYRVHFKKPNPSERTYYQNMEATLTVIGGGNDNWVSPYFTLHRTCKYSSNPTAFDIEFFADKPRVECTLNYNITGDEYVPTSETRYDQISAEVTDPNSIAEYGERDGGSVEYPLLETVEQCITVGSKAIRDSHRLLGQINFSIPFNPLIQTGQTIAISDNKIGLTERYYIESVNHNINFSEGKISAETIVGGVLYV